MPKTAIQISIEKYMRELIRDGLDILATLRELVPLFW
jgi:hypothetical protein